MCVDVQGQQKQLDIGPANLLYVVGRKFLVQQLLFLPNIFCCFLREHKLLVGWLLGLIYTHVHTYTGIKEFWVQCPNGFQENRVC